MLRQLVFILALLVISFVSFSQKMENREMHNALTKREYDKIINAINNGSDPLAPIVTGGGGRRRTLLQALTGKSKGGGASGTDLLEKILVHENSGKRDELLTLIREKAKNRSLNGIWYLYNFFEYPHNLPDTLTLKWIINRKEYPSAVEISKAVEMRYNPLITYSANRFGWSALKNDLVRAAFCTDTTELAEAMFNRFGVYPRKRNGIRAIDVLEAQFGVCNEDYSWIITKLWDGGSRFNQKNRIGESIQENAVRTKDLILLKQLDELTDVRLNIVNKEKQNLLHQAAPLRQSEMIQFLIDRGVSLKAKDIHGKYPYDYAYEWDFKIRALLGDELSLKEQNTVFLTHIAKKNDEKISEYERTEVRKIVDSGEFLIEVLQSTRSDITLRKLKPSYKELIEIAEENRSWFLFSQLYANQKWKYKPHLYYSDFYKSKDSLFFQYMVPLDTELGGDLFEKMIDRWSLEAENFRSIIFSSYLKKVENEGLIAFEDPDGKPLLGGQKFESIGDLNDGYALAEKGGKLGVVAIDGEVLIPFEYDSIYEANIPDINGFYAITENSKLIFEISSKYGFEITLKDKINFTHQFKQRVYINRHAYYIVGDSGKFGLFKQYLHGLYHMFEPVYDEVKPLTYYHVAFRKGEKWAVAYLGASTPKLKFKYQDVKAVEDIEVAVKRKGSWESFRN